MIKQVVVVRTSYPDGKGGTKGLRAGKLIAQSCHASIAFLTNRIKKHEKDKLESAYGSYDYEGSISFSAAEKEWINGTFTKICVRVNSEQQLLEIEERAKAAGLECNLITDNGLTEFNGVPTKTCLAIGPDESEKIDLITGNLELY